MPITSGQTTQSRGSRSAPEPARSVAVQFSARATLLIGGGAHPEVDAAVLDWCVEERINSPARLDLLMLNWGTVGTTTGLRFDDHRVFDYGRPIELRCGNGTTLFSGTVCALGDEFPGDAPPRARVVAADRLQGLASPVRNRSFADIDDAGVARRVAADHGLQPDIDLPGPTRKLIAQLDCSDLDFLRQRAAVCDARLRVDGTRLAVRRFDAVDAPPMAFALGQELQSFSVEADLRGQPTSLTVVGWGAAQKEALRARATLEPSAADLPGGDTAAAIVARVGGDAPLFIGAASAGSASEASDLARALLAAKARSFVNGTGRLASLAVGLHAGSVVDLGGLGPLHGGHYRVTALRRRFDPTQGLFTEFEVQRNALGHV